MAVQSVSHGRVALSGRAGCCDRVLNYRVLNYLVLNSGGVVPPLLSRTLSVTQFFKRGLFQHGLAAAGAAALMSVAMTLSVHAQDTKPVAKVGGKVITEADVKLAEAEIGGDLGQLPDGTKRRVLIEYLIENEVFATAAEGAKLAAGPAYELRLGYWRRRALRDMYFETAVRDAVKDDEAKKFYDEQVKAMKPQDEVQAKHILVEDEAKAKDIIEKLGKGGDFAALAKENSKDPGSKDNGGDLGYFGRGQMVPEFEAAAFELDKGKISAPVKSAFGFHVIKVEDKRTKAPPTFDQVKDRIKTSMMQQKAQVVGTELRNKAQIEYLDEAVKKMVDDEKAKAAPAAAPDAKKDAPPAKK